MNLVFNDEQKKAIEEVDKFINDIDRIAYTISGLAGTGKTTIIKECIKNYKGKVYLTATTNQAVEVAKRTWSKSSSFKIDITTGTIHKILGIYLDIEYDKESEELTENLKREENYSPDFIPGNTLLIIDEASMLSKKILQILKITASDYKLKLIFMGDHHQLPPVNENESEIFNTQNKSVLTKVMRQKEGSHLHQYIEKCRTEKELPIPNEDVELVTSKTDFLNKAIELYKSKEFITNPYLCKVLAWRRKVVEEYNDLIIKSLGQDTSKYKFFIGERIISTKQFFKNRKKKGETIKDIILNNSEEATITNISLGKRAGITTYELELLKDDNTKVIVPIVKETNFRTFLSKLNRYKYKYIKSRSIKDKMVYTSFLNSFGSVSPSYCVTVHRSQGSTYEHVFINHSDIKRIKDVKREAVDNEQYYLKCRYTAVSRSSKTLTILEE